MGRVPTEEQILWDEETRTYIIEPPFNRFGCADDWEGESPPNDLGEWNQCQADMVEGLTKIFEKRLEYAEKKLPVITKKKIWQQLRWALTRQEKVRTNHRVTLDPCKEIAVRTGLIRKNGPLDFGYKDRPA